MSDNVIKTRVIIRNDTKTALDASTVILYKGEIAIEIHDNGISKFKIGNGVDVYRDLPYSTLTPYEINTEVRNIISDYVTSIAIKNGSILTYMKGDGTSTDLQIPIATTETDGLLSSADKIKYDSYKKIILSDTTQNWNMYPETISTKDTIYVYSNYQIDSDLKYIPGIKIGDGVTPIVDLPFIDDAINNQITNILMSNVTEEEKRFWNNKVRCYMDNNDIEKLIFTTH